MNTQLQYRSFDQLMSDVLVDLPTFNLEGMVEPAQLIKVAQKINYDLGLKIHSVKEKVLEVSKGKARLPLDFYVLNFALLCGKYQTRQPVLSGTHREDIILDAGLCKKCGNPDPTCECEKTYTTDCGTHVQVIEKKRYETRVFEHFERLYIRPGKYVDSKCCNTTHQGAPYNAEIRDGFLYTNLQEGSVFINYQGAMENEDGELVVLDHPMINEYYEYAFKQRILENLYLNGEDMVQKLMYVEKRLREARNAALGIVNTPDFSEMYKVWWGNRLAMYDKYHTPFQSHGWI